MIIRAFILLAFSLLLPWDNEGIKDAESLIFRMYERYHDKWYQTLAFEQKITYYDEEGDPSKEEVWYEALKMPDKLAIKFNGWETGNGLLIRNDSLYQFKQGSLAGSRPILHPLLILGFSVYAQPPTKTIHALDSLGFDLTKFHKREYAGKKIYVVGADEGDEKATQFWIEKNRLLLIRSIQNFGEDRIQDIRFNRYEPLNKGWIAKEILFYGNGKLRLREEYRHIRTPVLDPGIFNPQQFSKAKW